MKKRKKMPGYVTNIILGLIFIVVIVLWGVMGNKSEERKLSQCSIYTVGQVSNVKHRSFTSRLIYSFTINSQRIEKSSRPNPWDIDDFNTIDFDEWRGRRFWIKVYCEDPSIHRVLWRLPVSDTLRYVPENGWSQIPEINNMDGN